jgi:predicted MFS family arabinose efflux permease
MPVKECILTNIANAARLAVAWLTMFLVGTELFVFSPILPILAADYQTSPAIAGLSVTMFSLTYMVTAPLFGRLADRLGRRRVLVGSLLAFAAASLLTASAANLPCLLTVRLFAGAAAAGITPSIYALIGSAATPDRRATWLALTVSGLLASLALGAPAGGLVGASFGWSPVFVALAGFSLVLAWLNRQVWPAEPMISAVLAAPAGPFAGAILLRRLVPMVVWSTGLYGVYTYLGAGLGAVGFSTGRTAHAIFFYGCGALAGVLIGGRAADRLGVKFTAGASFAGFCACLLLLRLALHTGRLVEPALGLSAAVAQLFFPAQQAGLANDFPGQRGAALAWNNSALFCGITLGSLLGGEAVTHASFDANLTISAGIALIGWIVTAVVVPGRASAGGICAKDSPRR